MIRCYTLAVEATPKRPASSMNFIQPSQHSKKGQKTEKKKKIQTANDSAKQVEFRKESGDLNYDPLGTGSWRIFLGLSIRESGQRLQTSEHTQMEDGEGDQRRNSGAKAQIVILSPIPMQMWGGKE